MSKTKLIRNTATTEAAIQRGIAADPDNPEWTANDFAKARPFVEVMQKRMGRPPKENPKEQLTMRYDAEVLEAFRATGAGWQTRMNDALKTYLKEHPLKVA
ncbi:BrnA antitoxin family protein [Paraburkholderia phosphatilytica]|uniref:BrnA antitoxin family protein n=1 Tax=Paraburkholderia phosphatilytica TaxID=2282883 RepID=UPI000E470102|nr:BrnA antitoxin family protein [Paraburkholderia phosphatilytica]